jgi:hypothetical protein
LVAGRLAARAAATGSSGRVGEAVLVVALVVANPTLWATALSMLVAIVPLWRGTRRSEERAGGGQPSLLAASPK